MPNLIEIRQNEVLDNPDNGNVNKKSLRRENSGKEEKKENNPMLRSDLRFSKRV